MRMGLSVGAALLLLVVMLGGEVNVVQSFHSSGMCVQVGQSINNAKADDTKGHFEWNTTFRTGYYTIGARKFDLKYTFLDNSYFGSVDTPFYDYQPKCPYAPWSGALMGANFCPGDLVEIKTYAVKQDGVVMAGWLHVEIRLNDTDDEILAIYVQMRDEHFNAIGEFITEDRMKCKPSNATLIGPSKYQVLPCSAVGYREAKNSNAILMARPDVYSNGTFLVDGNFIPTEQLKEGIHFTWRFSEYWCNRHYRIRPEATILTKKTLSARMFDPNQQCFVLRKAADYWIRPGWFGAADIKLWHTKLTCDEEVIDYKTGNMSKANGQLVATWLVDDTIESVLANDYVKKDNTYIYRCSTCVPPEKRVIKSCQYNIWNYENLNIYPEPWNLIPTFAGRCTHHYKKDPSHVALQGCNLDVNGEEFQGLPPMETYEDYLNTLRTNRTNLCNTSSLCRVPDNGTDLETIKKISDESGITHTAETITEYNRESRSASRRSKLWQGFKYHAELCLIWTMFVTPLSIFAARYYKETFMQHSCSGIHVWYWIHIGCLVVAIMLFGSSYTSMLQNNRVWGHIVDNDHADLHRLLGWSSVGIFLFMSFLGGCRMGVTSGGAKIRLATMTLHSLLGFIQYFLNLAALINSTQVPGSPTSAECDPEKIVFTFPQTTLVTFVWMLVDLTFHITLTVLQFITDKKRKIRRGWCFPFLTFLPPNAIKDMKGSAVRKILFFVYVASAFVLTLTNFVMIFRAEDPKCMEYTTWCQKEHSDWIYGCSPLGKRFYEKDYQNQTNITEQTLS